MWNNLIKNVCVICLVGAVGVLQACEDKSAKPDDAVATETETDTPPQPETTLDAPASQPAVPEADAPPAKAAVDDAVMAGHIEQLKETCAKLEAPILTACTAFHDKVVAKDAAALADLDAVLNGTKVEGNMVMLDEKVADMLIKKYAPSK